MSIPPNSSWRGCAAAFPQPLSDNDVLAVQNLVETVYHYNCHVAGPPLPGIVYRSSDGEGDVRHHVFPWDRILPEQAFELGFQARPQDHTPDDVFFDLFHYVQHGGRPLDSFRSTLHAFVSITVNGGWYPNPNLAPQTSTQMYRYEIYAPGGIFVSETLGDDYDLRLQRQDEIAFVSHIAPQYVRSAQLFRATRKAGSIWRGCAAAFPQPLSDNDVLAVQNLVETVYRYNCHVAGPPLPDIVYRSSDGEGDVRHHVFRWDRILPEQAFELGFQARPQDHTPDDVFFDLFHYVQHGGRPLDSFRSTLHVFVSTTVNSGWYPNPNLAPQTSTQMYRYEIYAPGGIFVSETLGDDYDLRLQRQDEIAFVSGIAPQYIRSAQLFQATREAGSIYARWKRVSNMLIYNDRFNPQSHPYRSLRILRPVCDYITEEDGTRRCLNLTRSGRQKREVSDSSDANDWYSSGVIDAPNYITAAFRAAALNEAYIFMGNEYFLLNYAPGSTNDRVVKGPHLVCDGFPSLINSVFGEQDIDCAFNVNTGKEAFIFSANLCAHIDYAPDTTDDKILRGPMTINAMFPFLKGTVFENGVDAAFTAPETDEAYLFKGDQYGLINYGSNSRLIAIRAITRGFNSLRGTIFATGIEAAFASHRYNEAYIFKGDQYALINFAPGSTNDKIIGGTKPILPNWPSLSNILPTKNGGLDVHYHQNHRQEAGRPHDEL